MKKLLCLLAGLSVAPGFMPASAQPAQAPPPKKARPAPVMRLDGVDYYLIDWQKLPGNHTMAFLKDGDNPETCSRRLWLRKVACKDLRAYEKAYTARWDQSQRDVSYRSAVKLVHSGWSQEGSLMQWRLMHWELHNGALLACELELLSRPPLADVKAMGELVKLQRTHWTGELKTLFRHAPALLP